MRQRRNGQTEATGRNQLVSGLVGFSFWLKRGRKERIRISPARSALGPELTIADDLAYLRNPIWWAGMVTSESCVADIKAVADGSDCW